MLGHHTAPLSVELACCTPGPCVAGSPFRDMLGARSGACPNMPQRDNVPKLTTLNTTTYACEPAVAQSVFNLRC